MPATVGPSMPCFSSMKFTPMQFITPAADAVQIIKTFLRLHPGHEADALCCDRGPPGALSMWEAAQSSRTTLWAAHTRLWRCGGTWTARLAQ